MGIMIFDPVDLTFYRILDKKDPQKKLSNISNVTTVDAFGNVWVGSLSNEGIAVISNIFTPFHAVWEIGDRGLFDSLGYLLRSIDMSNDNTLWIGGGYFLRAFNLDSKTLGPDKYLRIAECFINYFPGDGYHFIRSGPQGNLWISSFTCLFKYYPKTGDHLLINPYSGKKPTVINGLEWDSLGYAWGGGYRGIVRINPNTGEYFSLKMDLIFTEEDDHSIFSVDKSSKGQILFQNYRNLFSLEIIKDNVWDDLYIERYMIREVIP